MISITVTSQTSASPGLCFRIMTESALSPEGRININDVPDQISRIFFGQGGNRPHYTDDTYGAPGFSGPGFGFTPGPLLYRGEGNNPEMSDLILISRIRG